MNLNDVLSDDLSAIFSDEFGFKITVTLIDPLGVSQEINALANDISLLADNGISTGIPNRDIFIHVSLRNLREVGFSEIPKPISDTLLKPWRIIYTNKQSETNTFKVFDSVVDKTQDTAILRMQRYDS